MILKLLQIENIGKTILRIMLSLVLLLIGISTSTQGANTASSLICVLLIVIACGLHTHYFKPTWGIVFGGLAMITFISLSVWMMFKSFSAFDLTMYLLFASASLVATGQSFKEYIRQRITAPFPKR
ncbi:hypothetical protein [Penaeicola halotolerans]|uniref:hypothetical protein n=1 Tax=Penaeicola halotolerans TaxID=2793196 RepID=UPI001CF81D09|nr:hypothetical protein [Penaeicola halotolerans]